MEIKKTTKKDISLKKAYVMNNVLYDSETGESVELVSTIEKLYGNNEVKISVTASETEDVTLPSDDEE